MAPLHNPPPPSISITRQLSGTHLGTTSLKAPTNINMSLRRRIRRTIVDQSTTESFVTVNQSVTTNATIAVIIMAVTVSVAEVTPLPRPPASPPPFLLSHLLVGPSLLILLMRRMGAVRSARTRYRCPSLDLLAPTSLMMMMMMTMLLLGSGRRTSVALSC